MLLGERQPVHGALYPQGGLRAADFIQVTYRDTCAYTCAQRLIEMHQ